MMQKTFSQEIRFKDENGNDYPEWEEKRLEEVSKVNQGIQIPIGKRFLRDGENRYFYITNEFLKLGTKTRYYIENPPGSVICTKDDILMTRTSNRGIVLMKVEELFIIIYLKLFLIGLY